MRIMLGKVHYESATNLNIKLRTTKEPSMDFKRRAQQGGGEILFKFAPPRVPMGGVGRVGSQARFFLFDLEGPDRTSAFLLPFRSGVFRPRRTWGRDRIPPGAKTISPHLPLKQVPNPFAEISTPPGPS